ncbi:MAG: Fe-S cluster assembly protein SufD [Prevotellaceae bacterium]|jgi:Fe-S cluster assembly protein SufD|nr:Fe-S cluster assembly protein SufD [Prevotellaceae bacterium]
MTPSTQYIDFYRQMRDIIYANSSTLLNSQREAAFEQFNWFGFPAATTEEYQYTDLVKPFAREYGLNIKRLRTDLDARNVFRCNVGGIGSYNYLVVNDDFIANPQPAKLPAGVVIGSLREVSERQPELVAPYLNKLSQTKNDGFVAFNGMFAQDGFFMYIPDNVVIEKPIQLVNLMRANVDFMANSRNLIVLGKNAHAQLLVCEHTAGEVHYFANRLTEIYVAENADFQYYALENTGQNLANFSTVLIDQKENSQTLTNTITLHNGITHNNTEIYLNGEQAQTLLCGMVTSDKNQSTSNATAIFHNAPNCTSTELFKYILDENSVCGFSGKIFVERNAQKTSAFQTNRNILLTNTARMRTKPQLEIYADDVKCSHGATIGQLDENALFYMQQRGIPKTEARLLLMYAFAAEIVDKIRIAPLCHRIKMMTENRLRGGRSQAGNCAMCL